MVTVVGVRFKKAGKIYYFDPGTLKIDKGNFVIVETVRGVEYGEVVVGPKEISPNDIVSPLKNVIRIATEDDKKRNKSNKEKEQEAFNVCQEKVEKHNLDMKLTDVEYTFDNNKIIFYFTADGRVDFRELVKDLAAVFKTRIELRQIGVRDEAKMLGGIGPCGRPLCCSSWLGDFEPVSIKMAKDQNLSLNPLKISGICSRLFCCLKYEHDVYQKVLDKLPGIGATVLTPNGKGTVVETNTLLEQVKVKVKNLEDNTEEIKLFNLSDVTKVKKADPSLKDQRKLSDKEIDKELKELEE
ncbi:regulatory iron-sulfur-containing complex subunit RicT [Serpentinicella sp. ANB-PHB4]|uniref:PSP1 domain-containing protein n=1 Tax=Serpentinicella sp. ANB-PHB4 TaxID=3074076 RepID=UPI00285A821C|nr:regulatory iron-sulfur-containing complex subunit RicT [Serpentinicella sp. ANB-PHB4]MDR5659219.1 regulatory iron-sulfur-containing complex subunit RicT [Serpentinicella sp. ANB-PHB4]